MERVNAVSPCHLDPETVVLGAMAVFPLALFAAGKVLLWDYQVSSLMLHSPHGLHTHAQQLTGACAPEPAEYPRKA